MHATDFDTVTIEDLRRAGSVKWTLFPDAIGAFVAEMDFGTAPAVTAALHEAVDVGRLGYLPPAAAEEMGAACAAWCADAYGWKVDPARIRPVGDVLVGLQMTLTHFSQPGSPVILPTPAYMPFVTLPPSLGHPVIEVPLAAEDGRYVYDLDALDAAFRAGGRVLVLCNPHNPVGRVLDRKELVAISEIVDRHGGRVFADEVHAPLTYADRRHVPYASISEVAASHTLTATSASKAWNLPGLKCAQVILSNDADAETWQRVGLMAEHGASTLGVLANTAAYTDGREWLDEVLSYLDGNRRLLAEMLAGTAVGYTPPEGTYLAWLDCRRLGLGDHPSEFFLSEAATALTDGALCGEAGRGFVRMNFALARPLLVRAVESMASALSHR